MILEIYIWGHLCVDGNQYPGIRPHDLGWHRNSSPFNIWKHLYFPVRIFSNWESADSTLSCCFSELWYGLGRRKETNVCSRCDICCELSMTPLLYFIESLPWFLSLTCEATGSVSVKSARRQCDWEMNPGFQCRSLGLFFFFFIHVCNWQSCKGLAIFAFANCMWF